LTPSRSKTRILSFESENWGSLLGKIAASFRDR
jgi:hypothetical protein